MRHGPGRRGLTSISARRLRRGDDPPVDDSTSLAPSVKSVLGSSAIIVPLAAAAVTLLRLYSATGYNIALTITSLGVVDRAQLLLGTLLTSFVLVSLASAFVCVYYLTSRRPQRWAGKKEGCGPEAVLFPRYSYPAVAALATSSVVLIAMTPVVVVAVGLIMLGAAVVLGFLRRHFIKNAASFTKVPTTGSMLEMCVLGCATALITVAVLVLVGRASTAFPLQTFEQVRTHEDVYTNVWVMGSQSEDTLLMNDRQEVRWVKTSSIISRQVCGGDPSTPPSSNRSLLEIAAGGCPATNLLDYAPCQPDT